MKTTLFCFVALLAVALGSSIELASDAGLGEKQCVPNSSFKVDCNSCTCSSDGTYAICTALACHRPNLTPIMRLRRDVAYSGRTCVPGTTFKRDCNTCTCSPNGRVAACTIMACPSDFPGRFQYA